MLYAVTGMGGQHIVLRKVDGAEILRRVDRHGVTLLCGAPAVLNMILDAAADWDGEVPGRGRVRMVVAGAPPPTRTIERTETELGWEFIQIYGLTETSPLLTLNRRRAEYDELSPADRAVRLNRAGGPALGCEISGRRPGRGPRAQQRRDGRLLAAARCDRRGDRRRLVPHRRRRLAGRVQLRDDLGPQEGRDHLRWGERVVDRGRGRDLPTPGRDRGGGDRRPRREVGRARDRARREDARAATCRPTT